MSTRPMYAGRATIAYCLWCRQALVDGKVESGYTGDGPDYMTDDGDYGCDASPDTTREECGSHAPDTFRTWDGHVIRATVHEVVDHVHAEAH